MQSDSKSNFHLVGLRREGEDTIELIWNDGRVDRWTAQNCVSCVHVLRAERSSEVKLKSKIRIHHAFTCPDRRRGAPLRVQSMEPVGICLPCAFQ